MRKNTLNPTDAASNVHILRVGGLALFLHWEPQKPAFIRGAARESALALG
jgi:hypothetical protein